MEKEEIIKMANEKCKNLKCEKHNLPLYYDEKLFPFGFFICKKGCSYGDVK